MRKLSLKVNVYVVVALVISQVLISARTYTSSADNEAQYLPKPHEAVYIDWALVPSFDDLELTSLSAIAVELPSGRILGARDTDIELPLASLTKLMTSVVALESKVGLESDVTYQAEDGNGIISRFINVGDKVSRLDVKPGDKLHFRDFLAASLIASANNAATSIARASGLTREQFVKRMNERAAVLGMSTATFTEVTGLDVENAASVFDVAILARYAWRNLVLRELSGTANYPLVIPGSANLSLQHTNPIARSKQPFTVVASKTGYLEESGYNMALMLRDRRQRQYLIVLMNAPTLEDRTQDALNLAGWLEKQP